MSKLIMPKSIKVLLITVVVFVAFLLIAKFVLHSNEWLYIRVATRTSKEKLVEKQWCSLEGRWYVSEKDDSTNAAFDVNDKSWNTERYIYVGQVKGATGVKWFRKHFTLRTPPPSDTLLVCLSVLDMQSKIFINGFKTQDTGFINNGSICYKVPAAFFKMGKNTIAVRTLPNMRNLGVVTRLRDEIIVTIPLSVPLKGAWRFSTGDNYAFCRSNFNDSSWKRLYVPRSWDDQGFKKFDGIAWYRKAFTCPADFRNQELVFFGGRIDDFNEVYINGVKIGGNIFRKFLQNNADDWINYVVYKFDGSILEDNNIVAIRVFDAKLQGGIYEGPVGIMTLKDFYSFYRK